jgi:hypothetical protein
MMIKPMAKGTLVVPEEKELINWDDPGIKYPIETPISIAKKIQRVRNRSRKLSLFFMV